MNHETKSSSQQNKVSQIQVNDRLACCVFMHNVQLTLVWIFNCWRVCYFDSLIGVWWFKLYTSLLNATLYILIYLYRSVEFTVMHTTNWGVGKVKKKMV